MKKLSEKQKRNAFGILDALAKSDITSRELRIGILCVAAKESGLIPRREGSYANTSNERIRKIFGKKKLKLWFLNDWPLEHFKKNPEMFFSYVYAGVTGNGDFFTMDGYRYRGGGYNQLTGRANYRLMQRLTGWELVDGPELIRYSECAAACLVAFFERALRRDKGRKEAQCGIGAENSVFYIAWINAGIGKKPESKAVSRAYENAMKWLPTMEEVWKEWSEK
jgi:predicted chitinase